MKYLLNTKSDFGKCEYNDGQIDFVASGNYGEARFFLDIDVEDYEDDSYLMIPACAYNGNRFKLVERAYAPQYLSDEVGDNEQPLIMRGIPSLGKDADGRLECTTADAASPIIVLYNRHSKSALFVFTEQSVKDKNIGYSISKGKISLQFPAMREFAYRFHLPPEPNPDSGISVKAGEKISSKVFIREYECESIAQLYEIYFGIRKLLLSDPRPKNGYTPELLNIMINHFNEHNYSGQYYGNTLWITWQPGWTGGGISSYPLYVLGDELTKKRAVETLNFATKYISKAGLPTVVYNFDNPRDDSKYLALRSEDKKPEYEHMAGAHLVRRSGDFLMFLIKQLRTDIPKRDRWIEVARGIADTMCKVFFENGTFGQYVNLETGKIMVKMSCAGASVVGALCMASEYFGEPEYLRVAVEAGEFYHEKYVKEGMTLGGVGDALTAPDSESAYAFVESYIALYETTNDKKWLDYAKESVHIFSSWVMTYSFKFPKHTEYGILGINTVGSVFANVQNKHSAPGICTFSGDAIYKIYRYTKNPEYLELIKDIAYFMPQCVSTKDRPIYDWDHEHGDPEGMLPEGYICERVNTSDWEYDKCVGGVFNVSCWCETSILLTFLELMDKPEMKE